MYRGGKAARIGNALRGLYARFIAFRKAVHKIAGIFLQSEIIAQIDDLDMFRKGMFRQKRRGLSVWQAQEKHVDIGLYLVCEDQLRVAEQVCVKVAHFLSGLTAAEAILYVHFRMMEEKANEFAAGIACSADNSCFFHVGNTLSLHGSMCKSDSRSKLQK